MSRMMETALLYTLLATIFWYNDWIANCAPTKPKFDLKKYTSLNFTMSEKELLDVAAILRNVNEIAERQRSELIDEKASDTLKSTDGFKIRGTNITISASSDSEPMNISSGDHYLFEGDILLSPQQAGSILEELLTSKKEETNDETQQRVERSAVFYDKQAKWPTMPILYDYDSSITSFERKAINDALEYWRTHTCIWFEQKPGIKDGDYLSFFKGDDDSCYSHVGKIGGKQPISIGRNCAKMGYVAHEIGHALGMWHEQARPDSNNYIQIMWQNVPNDRSSNFLKRTWSQTETYGIPYDMGSVMHYGPYAFTSNEKYATIETKVPAYSKTIGQREAPSFLDVKAVNKLYCEGKCQIQYPCSNGGYTHPGFCNGCLCPDGLTGTYCDKPEDSKNANCGGLVYINDDWKNISSPNYPEHYDNNQRCSWLLRSPTGTRVMMEFIDIFQLACGPTCVDYVEVKNDTSFVNTGIRYCCFEKPSYTIYSQSNEMIVIFNSGFTTFSGFKARVTQYPHSR